MAVDYLRDYLGIDPADYSAMEQNIAGVSPVGQSIIPTMGATPTVQPRMIDDTSIAFNPRPMQDFGAQISGLEEQINNLMEQMGVLEAEKNDALQQQDVMRAELAQAQQDALTEQANEFEGVKSSLEQQIADLTAQIGGMQEPTIMKDAPVPPRDEQIFVPPKDFVDPIAIKRLRDESAERRDVAGGDRLLKKDMIMRIPPQDKDIYRGGRAMELYDKLGNMVAGSAGVTPPEFAEYRKSPIQESFADFLARKRGDVTPRLPSVPPMTPPMTPMTPPMTPMPMPEPVMPTMPMPQPMIPIEPQSMSMAGGQMNMMFDNMRPTMMRAGGGGISKAIVDLESKLR